MKGFGIFDFDTISSEFVMLDWSDTHDAAVVLMNEQCEYMDWTPGSLAIIPMNMVPHIPVDMSVVTSVYDFMMAA